MLSAAQLIANSGVGRILDLGVIPVSGTSGRGRGDGGWERGSARAWSRVQLASGLAQRFSGTLCSSGREVSSSSEWIGQVILVRVDINRGS